MRRITRDYRIFGTVLLALALAGCSRVSQTTNDAQITSAIQAKLYQNAELKPLSIGVSTSNGVVTLSGDVNAPLEKLAVEDLAQKTAGVKQVVDNLTVAAAPAPPLPADEQTASAQPAAPVRPARHRARERKRQIAEEQPAQPSVAARAAAQDLSQNQPAPSADPSPAAQPAPPAQPPPAPAHVTIPAGTDISVRMIDSVSSKTAKVGQQYSASLAAPLVAGGQVVIPQGTNVHVRVVFVNSAGHYAGRSELKLALQSISFNGTDYPVQTSYFDKQGASRGKNSAEKIGGGAALGALLGAVIGHGKGAGIGAAIGGAAGTAAQTATHGQEVTVPTETRIDFTLKAPLTVTPPSSN
ncbi:MAG: BON domain-containing protein [Acidobacteriota bacterium]|nr:BON domain-containing protein [Acidobacteriota bacterium]